MKAVTLEDWVDDLRTTDAGQTRNKLRDGGNSFCCLGRLLNLVNPNGWSKDLLHWSPIGGGLKSAFDVPSPVLEDLGWLSRVQMTFASSLNDGRRFTFSEIADWVEAGMPTGGEGISWIAKVERERETV